MNLAILTSGGDAPGMNAATRAFVRQGLALNHQMWGIPRGFDGLLHDDPLPLSAASVANILMTGGTFLKTSRYSGFRDSSYIATAAQRLFDSHMDGLAVVGGNGSMAGALALSRSGVAVIGIPASIDNDVPNTDYSIGFDTAVNNIVASIDKIRDTATSHERTYVIEVMGRNAGDIAMISGLAGGAESILVPEFPFDMELVLEKLRHGQERGKRHSIILVAEGAAQGMKIGEKIRQETGWEVRVTVLGHLQRGGSPSAFDRILASRMGAYAVDLLRQGQSSQVIGLQGKQLVAIDIDEALAMKRSIDMSVYELAAILSI